jgi:hypothetical protein
MVVLGRNPFALGNMGDRKVAGPWEVRRHVAPPSDVDPLVGLGKGNPRFSRFFADFACQWPCNP